ncbi:MAG: hypothetical protein QM811_31995 [Pirellulales bacterium]
MPAKATDAIHFISGGDCGVNPHAVANNIQAARQDPAFAVIGGDLAYDNGKSVETQPRRSCGTTAEHMVDAGRPAHPDGRLHRQPRGRRRLQQDHAPRRPFFYALFDGLFPETGYATLDFGDYLSLVLLDTGHTTPIAGYQTDWLEKTLKARVRPPERRSW